MIGVLVMLAGVVSVVAGFVLVFGWPAALIPFGCAVFAAGLTVDFDRVKEPKRAKRSSQAP